MKNLQNVKNNGIIIGKNTMDWDKNNLKEGGRSVELLAHIDHNVILFLCLK